MDAVILTTGGASPARYAARLECGRIVRAVGPLGRTEGQGLRAVTSLLEDDAARDAPHLVTCLTGLLEAGEAHVIEVPDVARVQVGVMGDGVDAGPGAYQAALAWIGCIRKALGIDDVSVGCTVNLRGLPAREYCTAYWTADGRRHDRTAPDDETFRAIVEWCWDEAVQEAKPACPGQLETLSE